MRPASQALDSDLIKSCAGATEGVLTILWLNPVARRPVFCSTLGLLMSVFVLLEYAEQTDLQGVGAAMLDAVWRRCREAQAAQQVTKARIRICATGCRCALQPLMFL